MGREEEGLWFSSFQPMTLFGVISGHGWAQLQLTCHGTLLFHPLLVWLLRAHFLKLYSHSCLSFISCPLLCSWNLSILHFPTQCFFSLSSFPYLFYCPPLTLPPFMFSLPLLPSLWTSVNLWRVCQWDWSPVRLRDSGQSELCLLAHSATSLGLFYNLLLLSAPVH